MDRKGTFFVAPIPLDPTVVQKISFSHKKIAKTNKEYEAVGSSQSPQSSTIAREKSVAMRSGRIKKKKKSVGRLAGCWDTTLQCTGAAVSADVYFRFQKQSKRVKKMMVWWTSRAARNGDATDSAQEIEVNCAFLRSRKAILLGDCKTGPRNGADRFVRGVELSSGRRRERNKRVAVGRW